MLGAIRLWRGDFPIATREGERKRGREVSDENAEAHKLICARSRADESLVYIARKDLLMKMG